MCGMALVHCRLNKLFFFKEGGGSILKWNINCNNELNHRYQVFQLITKWLNQILVSFKSNY